MTIYYNDDVWLVVAHVSELKKSPLRVFYQGIPIVLFKHANNIHALKDQCPHRGTPLSMGCVKQGTIVCPYHGWQFDSAGKHVAMPGNPDFIESTKTIVQSFDVAEDGGLIWVRHKTNKNNGDIRYIPNIHISHPYITTSKTIEAGIVDIAENFLDPLHTHFVHPGIIRFSRVQRHNCTVSISTVEHGYQATYIEEKQQSGIMSKLFGQHITKSVGRIRYPGIIEVEYYSDHAIELAVVIYLNQENNSRCKLIMRSYIKKKKIPFFIVAAILTPFQYLTFLQDKHILEAVEHLKNELQPSPLVVTDCDVMRPYIERALKQDIVDVSVEKNILL